MRENRTCGSEGSSYHTSELVFGRKFLRLFVIIVAKESIPVPGIAGLLSNRRQQREQSSRIIVSLLPLRSPVQTIHHND
jgi:hypothetical protein